MSSIYKFFSSSPKEGHGQREDMNPKEENINYLRNLKDEHAHLEEHYDGRKEKRQNELDNFERKRQEKYDKSNFEAQRISQVEFGQPTIAAINSQYHQPRVITERKSKLFVLLINLSDFKARDIADGINVVLNSMTLSTNKIMIWFFDQNLVLSRGPQFINQIPRINENEIPKQSEPAMCDVLHKVTVDIMRDHIHEHDLEFIILTNRKADKSNLDRKKAEKILSVYRGDFPIRYIMISRDRDAYPEVGQWFKFTHELEKNFLFIIDLINTLERRH